MLQEHFFEERGIYYRSSEIRSDRTTLVFVHGLTPSSAVWLPYEPHFEGAYNIVSPDLRGHGRSRKPGRYEDYRIEEMTGDIDALLTHLGVEKYIPVSSSLSCLIMLILLKERPGAVAAIFLNPLYGTKKILLTRISEAFVAGCAKIAGLFSYSNKPGKHTDYKSLGRVWDLSPKLMLREIPNTTLHVYLFCLDNLYKRDFDAWWQDVKVPILLIHGEHDIISPVAQIRRLASTLPNAKLVVLPHGSHVMPLNYPDEIAGIMNSFLKDLPN
ncbi:MAG TPA: alpha/beta hydrolase [Candidatus Paceibacterota bacterium]|nr:alpha/beta hydrolase [Candidatus Paceibacterota bacterium]